MTSERSKFRPAALRRAIKASGLSPRQISIAAGVQLGVLATWLEGWAKPQRAVLMRVARVIRADLGSLYDES